MGCFKEFVVIFLFFFCYRGLYCDETIFITPIEELQTENIYILDIREQVLSSDDYSRLNALSSIEKTIKIGSLQSIKYELLSVLYYLSTYNDPGGDEQLILHTRRKAVELIGRLGERTRETEFSYHLGDVLLTLLRNDDIAVVSSIIFALGRLGYNNQGKTIRAIASAVDKWILITRDKTFALAVITSIEMIADANNGINEGEGYTILIKVMQSNSDIQIRNKAFEVMDKLSTYE